MKLLHPLDIIIILGSIQGILLALLIWNKKMFHKKANRFLAIALIAFSFNNLYFVILGTTLISEYPILIFLPLRWTLLIPAAFYFYVSYLINNDKKIKANRWWLFLPFLLQFLIQISDWIFYMIDLSAAIEWRISIGWIFFFEELLGLAFSIIMLLLILKKIKHYDQMINETKSTIEKYSLRWLYVLFFVLAFLWLLWLLPYLVGLFIPINATFSHYPLWIAMSIFIYWTGYKAYSKDEIFSAAEEPESYKASAELSANSKQLYQLVVQDIEQNKLYMNPEIDLVYLADRHQVSVGHLSRAINKHSKQNFFYLINYYRVEEVKKRLQDDRYSHLSNLGIAMDCGFNSKSTFNDVFKKLSGTTPSKYKKCPKN
jgi:AraC-like DNA-binding protein